MKNKITFGFILFFCCLVQGIARDYYVDPTNGNDNRNGASEAAAFRSLSRLNWVTLQPGDTVFLREGVYKNPGQTLMTINESGLPDQWITIRNYPNEKPILEFDSWVGIDLINGASYIKIKGLSIKGARGKITLADALNQPGSCANDQEGGALGLYNGTGILAVGPNLRWSNPETRGNEVPNHIVIEDCEIFDCTSSGIAFQQADYVTIRNNKVYNNAWYTLYGTSGINLYQFINTDNTTGIHNIITNNLMYGNELLVPQVPYCQFFDGNAFIVDDFNHTQTGNYLDADITYPAYSAKTLIKNNVAVENGGSGLHFFLSANCLIYNNTVIDNASQNNGANGNAELRIGNCSNFEIKNNIFKGPKLNAVSGNTNMDYSHNYQEGNRLSEGFAACASCLTEGIVFANMEVTNASPYITIFETGIKDTGIELAAVTDDYLLESRPVGNGFDIGAYELRTCEDTVWYADVDGDGVGSDAETQTSCIQPTGFVGISGDLCDSNPDSTSPNTWYVDTDGDGIGSETETIESCEQPTGFVAVSGDFCDNNADLTTPNIWYADTDGDGVGSETETRESCIQPEGFVALFGDLCDTDPNKTDSGICGCGVAEDSCDEPDISGSDDPICNSAAFDRNTVYGTPGTVVIYNGLAYENMWYAAGALPDAGEPWKLIKNCDSSTFTDCSEIPEWSSNTAYAQEGTQVVYLNDIYTNKWYTKGEIPLGNRAWQYAGSCRPQAKSNIIKGNQVSITIFPTITDDVLNLILPANHQVTIFSATGKLVLQKTFAKGQRTIDVQLLSKGMYFITATKDENAITAMKFIKK